MAGAGLASYGFIAQRPICQGIGLGGLAVGLPFFVIDTYNNGRAEWYQGQLQRFDPTLQVQAGRGRQPWSLGVALAY